jgi:peptidoglycan/LPS O-acetylase OafA/YrhL
VSHIAEPLARSRPRPLTRLTYRPDIDGLRALAVLAVMFFHYRVPPFSGGFAGVDIFFVISGYLITALIAREMAEDRFSLWRFYERRVRRIIPALFALLVVASVAAWFILFPHDFRRYAKSALAAAFFGSNFQFWSVTGYFDVAAFQKPLLHTWSLAVEEQFYLLFPAFLLALRAVRQRTRIAAVGAAFLLSLALSIWGVRKVPGAAFYLVPFRLWELMAGALLALGLVPPPRSARVGGAASLIGLILIACAVLFYSEAAHFPGAAALLPVLGTALVIYGGTQTGTFVNRVLARRPVVFVGLISYSLYLWHWPVYVFARYYLYRDLSAGEAVLCLALSFVLAVLSWRFVEQPFRRRQGGVPRRVLFGAAGAALVTVSVFAAAVLTSHGWPDRFRPDIRRILAEEHDTDGLLRYCFARPLSEVNAKDLCQFGAAGNVKPSFLLWGDSHADAILPAVSDIAKKHHLRGYFAGESSCAPLMGVFRPDTPRCKAFNNKVIALAKRPEIKTVILTARWGKNADGRAYGDEGNGFVPISDAQAKAKRPADNAAIFARGLNRTIDALLAAKKHVVVIASVPEVGWAVPQVLARTRLSGDGRPVFLPEEDFAFRQRITRPLFHRLAARPGVMVIHPSDVLCEDGRCKVAMDGIPLYRDEHHLSVYGAEKLKPLLTGIFGNWGQRKNG